MVIAFHITPFTSFHIKGGNYGFLDMVIVKIENAQLIAARVSPLILNSGWSHGVYPYHQQMET